MKTRARLFLILAPVLLLGAALWATLTQAAPGVTPLAQGGAPTMVSYQGEVYVSDSPYNGTGYFKFAVVDADGTTTYWSNDGTSTGGREPTEAVVLDVSDGLFSVLLGDPSRRMEPLRAAVFDDTERYLRVWFSSDGGTFEQLTPDTQVTAVPYALQAQEAANADTVDGLHASQLGADYENVIVVAKSGGDYTTVQAAIDSISDAAADNAYLVWIAPGVYSETVTLKPYVHLRGAGQEATVITSTVSSGSFPPTEATLELAADTSLRDLMVGNTGAGAHNVALLATTGTTRTLVADVTAQAIGSGTDNHAILMSGIDTGLTLQNVTALAENGSDENNGMLNHYGAAIVRSGSFTARGGTTARGIDNTSVGTTLEAEDVTALAEGGSDNNYGLYNSNSATTIRAGLFIARGGTSATGIFNSGTLEVESVTGLGENGSSTNYGLVNYSAATLRGSSFTGHGGTDTRGIHNTGSSAALKAENVTVLGEDSSNANYGLYNFNGTATLGGGSFTARGGTSTRGIYNSGTLAAESVTTLGENGSSTNYGLENDEEATVRGGSFTGHGGIDTRGIHNTGSSATLEAENVTTLGEDSSAINYGLYNSNGTATLRGSSFTAHGGADTQGIYNYGSTANLEADRVTVVGENGSSTNYGLYNYDGTATADSSQFTGDDGLCQFSGTVYLGASQLDGGATSPSGTLTCIHVYDGNYNDYICP